MQRMFAVATALALLLSTSCLSSLHGPSDPKQGGTDKALSGLWQLEEATPGKIGLGEVVTLAIGNLDTAAPLPWVHVTLLQHDGGKLKTTDFVGFVTVSGKHRYVTIASMRDLDLGALALEKDAAAIVKAVTGYKTFKYEITDDELRLWIGNKEFVMNAIEAGAAEGFGVELSGTPDEVLKYLEAHDADIFDQSVVFKRVGRPLE